MQAAAEARKMQHILALPGKLLRIDQFRIDRLLGADRDVITMTTQLTVGMRDTQLGVGFGASLVGVGATNALIAARQFLDPAWSSPNPPQDVVTMSAAYASYMAISSNLRYQVIAGVVEERGIETLLAGRPGLCSALSFVVRTGNTFLGSLMWVDYIRLLGLQKG